MLVVVGGLPGTGKTTISRALAALRSAVYLRIDVIEQAMRSAGVEVGTAGYVVANALAASNLAVGNVVIADCVNPVRESRQGWREVALGAGTRLLEVELVCSDGSEHRRRVEARQSDIAGLVVPTWQAVVDRDYAWWPEPHLTIDTAHTTPAAAAALLEAAMLQLSQRD